MEAVSTLRELYAGAGDPEAFHEALGNGDIGRAAQHHSLSENELRERIDSIYSIGMDLTKDYPEMADVDRDEFVDA
ncbi:hypothetical protein ACFQE1_02060 [Halobium palmae]|uniref:Uncharacterized protein n=1 Tax=Halobium palmae TaxID=1776492 RepID=A0ABD5RUT3_9EURY